jgi:selenocysteine lyase/cysteine desulfurase
MEDMCIDALCVPGHKGLFGPQGSGAVILGRNIVLDTLIEGGNGIDSMSGDMPLNAPERYEAGTVATPNIAGLREGVRFVTAQGIEAIGEHERRLGGRLREMLGNMSDITLYGPPASGGIVLFAVDGIPSEQIAAQLDRYKICVRGGYHCAALAHKTLGTPEGGAVRVSFGAFNKLPEVDTFYRVLKEII